MIQGNILLQQKIVHLLPEDYFESREIIHGRVFYAKERYRQLVTFSHDRLYPRNKDISFLEVFTLEYQQNTFSSLHFCLADNLPIWLTC